MNKMDHIKKAEECLKHASHLEEVRDNTRYQKPDYLTELNTRILVTLGHAQVHATLAVAGPVF